VRGCSKSTSDLRQYSLEPVYAEVDLRETGIWSQGKRNGGVWSKVQYDPLLSTVSLEGGDMQNDLIRRGNDLYLL
jgi:hypothetical protein